MLEHSRVLVWTAAALKSGRRSQVFVICHKGHYFTVRFLLKEQQIWWSDPACTGWCSAAEAALDAFASCCSWSWQAVEAKVQSFETDSVHCGVWACWAIMMLQGYFSSTAHKTFQQYMLAQYELHGVTELSQLRSRGLRNAAKQNTIVIVKIRTQFQQQVEAIAAAGDGSSVLSKVNYHANRKELVADMAHSKVKYKIIGPMQRAKRTKSFKRGRE